MIAIRNVKVERYGYSGLFEKLSVAYPEVKFSAEQRVAATKLIPQDSSSYTYELHNINTALANGWRRVIQDELEFPRFNCELKDIKSTDMFCAKMTDYVQNRIYLIPTQYLPCPSDPDLKKGLDSKKHTYTISVKNNTTDKIEVTSADIKTESKFEWNRNIGIIEIRPGCTFDASLTLEWGINKTHGSFAKLGPVQYQALDFPDYPAAATVVVKNYRLGITTGQLIDPKFVTILAWKTLRLKMQAAATAIGEIKVLPHVAPTLKVSTIRGDRIQYEFLGETATVTNILAWYGYTLDPSISFIAAGDNHIEDLSRVVNITHPEHQKLLQTAAARSVKDIDAILALLV